MNHGLTVRKRKNIIKFENELKNQKYTRRLALSCVGYYPVRIFSKANRVKSVTHTLLSVEKGATLCVSRLLTRFLLACLCVFGWLCNKTPRSLPDFNETNYIAGIARQHGLCAPRDRNTPTNILHTVHPEHWWGLRALTQNENIERTGTRQRLGSNTLCRIRCVGCVGGCYW